MESVPFYVYMYDELSFLINKFEAELVHTLSIIFFVNFYILLCLYCDVWTGRISKLYGLYLCDH